MKFKGNEKKVGFVHYTFEQDGVTRVVLNNIKAILKKYPQMEIVLIANSFSKEIPDSIEKRKFNEKSKNPEKNLEELTKDCDIIIIENPTVGVNPEKTLVFKKFAEKNKDKKIIYRTHDFVDDRPHLIKKFNDLIGNTDKAYPTTENVSYVTLTDFDRKRLLKKGLNNVKTIPNSIIFNDLNNGNKKDFREFLIKEKIIEEDEKIITYPVRILGRKNIEEALLLTKLINKEVGKFRLIVTIPFDKKYEIKLRKIAEDFKIPCSIGQVSQFIGFDDKTKFNISDLYALSDLVISTSVQEGFGFVFIEPWISGTPVIGRTIPFIIEEFERRGVKLNHLYGQEVLEMPESQDARIKLIREILSDSKKLDKISKKLDIKSRINMAIKIVKKNKRKIKKNYDFIPVTQKLIECLN